MMVNGHPRVFPWNPSMQICSKQNAIYNYKKHNERTSCLTEANQTELKDKMSLKNSVEAYWDRKIFGQLCCKRGSFRENLGK